MSRQLPGIPALEHVTHVHEHGTGALEPGTTLAQRRHKIALSRTVKEDDVHNLLKIHGLFFKILPRPDFLVPCRSPKTLAWLTISAPGPKVSAPFVASRGQKKGYKKGA
jgi:hypothetical protein